MRLELKSLKVHNGMSDETTCFEATLYADGRKVGFVSNRGCGGPNEYQWTDRELGAAVDQWANAQPMEFAHEKLDQIVDDLLTRIDMMKSLKRWTKKDTVFKLAGERAGSWRTVKRPYSPEVKAHLVQKYGDRLVIVANENLDAAVEQDMAQSKMEIREMLARMDEQRASKAVQK